MARVESRAGNDELAAEHFRLAYGQLADPVWLLEYARSAGRARLYAEALDALRRALEQAQSEDQRTTMQREMTRIAAQVPPGLVRVAVLVEPATARVELTRVTAASERAGAGDDAGKGGPAPAAATATRRIVLSSGHVYLEAGAWSVETSAKGYQSELRTLTAGEAGGDWLTISLAAEDAGPVLGEAGQGGSTAATAQSNTAAQSQTAAQSHTAAQSPATAQPPAARPAPASQARAAAAPVIAQPDPSNPAGKPQARSGPPTGAGQGGQPDGPATNRAAVAPAAPPAGVGVAAAQPADSPRAKSPNRALHKWGAVATSALGVVAMGVGALLGLQARANADAANGLRDQGLAKADYTSQFEFYRAATVQDASMATASWIGGGALVAAGTLWWLLAPRPATLGAVPPLPPTGWADAKAPPHTLNAAPAGPGRGDHQHSDHPGQR